MAHAPWASDARASRGRRFAEVSDPLRGEYQRDRDRVVHSAAFRRLVYKTQVFLNHEGDLFRTRLTHSLEVAQLGRSIARTLGLDEDLVEAIALAHDLGHTPFGHAGQDALDACLRAGDAASGGFEHNLQSLRIVDALEERYAQFDGLNLTFETREGILKRCSRRLAERLDAREPGGVAARFLHPGRQPGLEAQLVNLVDAMAYGAHDIDDGVRSGLIELEQLEALPLFEQQLRAACAEHPRLAGRRVLYEALRRLLAAQVRDVIEATQKELAQAQPSDADAVRAAGAPLVRFSPDMAAQSVQMQRFLHARLYRHAQVVATTERAQEVVRTLFEAYRAEPQQLPAGVMRPPVRLRGIADYVAGMTDRFALREYQRLTGRAAFDG